MEVQEIMTAKVITVGQDEPVTAAARLLRRWNLGALPVTDSTGRLRGVLTDRDIVLRCLALDNDPADTRVSEVMSRAVVTARPGDSVQSAAALMAREQLRRLPVAENGRLVGMVTACDLARREKLDAEFAEAMRGISANLVRRSRRSESVAPDFPIIAARSRTGCSAPRGRRSPLPRRKRCRRGRRKWIIQILAFERRVR